MIKVEYSRDSYSEEVMINEGMHYVEGGHSVAVSADIGHELTYGTDELLGFTEIGALYPKFPTVRDSSTQAVFDVVNITVLETTRVFLGGDH